ncbi:MAG: hypothetical protein ACYS9T_10520 [Planctomycetota bacterium]
MAVDLVLFKLDSDNYSYPMVGGAGNGNEDKRCRNVGSGRWRGAWRFDHGILHRILSNFRTIVG